MTEAEVLSLITSNIVANGNQEITADVLRPILVELLRQPNILIGDLGDLQTANKNNLVDAINEALQGSGSGSGIKIETGTKDPKVNPPSGLFIGDFYIWSDNTGLRGLYQYNGTDYVLIHDVDTQDVLKVYTETGTPANNNATAKIGESIKYEQSRAGVGSVVELNADLIEFKKAPKSVEGVNPTDVATVSNVAWDKISGNAKDINLLDFTDGDAQHKFENIVNEYKVNGTTINPVNKVLDITVPPVVGLDGKSAYEVWLETHTGTEADFFAFLKGDKGDKGDPFTYADFTPSQLAGLKGADGKSASNMA